MTDTKPSRITQGCHYRGWLCTKGTRSGDWKADSGFGRLTAPRASALRDAIDSFMDQLRATDRRTL